MEQVTALLTICAHCVEHWSTLLLLHLSMACRGGNASVVMESQWQSAGE